MLGHPLVWLAITLVCVLVGYVWMSSGSNEVSVEPVKKLSPETVSNNLDQVGEILKQDSMAISDNADDQRAEEYLAIEQMENSVNPLFLAAETHILNNQLVLPEGDNAWNDYSQVLEIDPGNSKAENGLIKIRNTLIDNAEIAIEVGNLEDAENWLVKLDIIQPGDPIQAELRADIKTQIELEAQAKLRQQEEQQRLQNIEKTLAQAKDEEAIDPLNYNKIKDLYNRVLELDPGNARATAGMERLISTLLDEAETRLRADDIDGAAEFLGKAQQTAPDNKRLGSIQLAMDTRLEQIEETQRRDAALTSIDQFVDTLVVEQQDTLEQIESGGPAGEAPEQAVSGTDTQPASSPDVETAGSGASEPGAGGDDTGPTEETAAETTAGIAQVPDEPGSVQSPTEDTAPGDQPSESPSTEPESGSGDSEILATVEPVVPADDDPVAESDSSAATGTDQDNTDGIGETVAQTASTQPEAAVETVTDEPAEDSQSPEQEPIQVASTANIIEEKSADEIADEARKAELEKGIRAYYDGDYNTSFELLYPLAEEGEARAQFRIGVMYRYGRSVSKNADLSEKWFTLALPTVLRKAQTGEAWAQTDLGTAYELGVSLTQDFERAAYWYRLAAEQNYPGAQTNLGVLYANGEGVDYNRSKAVFWLKKAANQGDLVALQNLNVMGEKL